LTSFGGAGEKKEVFQTGGKKKTWCALRGKEGLLVLRREKGRIFFTATASREDGEKKENT